MKRLLTLVFVVVFTLATSAQWKAPEGDVPAYNATRPAKGLKQPPILSGDQLTGPSFRHPAQTHSYKLAAKIPDVLHQLPCYCYCDRGHGHNSLRTCFESTHGAHCAACMREAIFAYKLTKEGKTPKQIREAIVRGEWEQIELSTAATDVKE
jgi:hypothetical protein